MILVLSGPGETLSGTCEAGGQGFLWCVQPVAKANVDLHSRFVEKRDEKHPKPKGAGGGKYFFDWEIVKDFLVRFLFFFLCVD